MKEHYIGVNTNKLHDELISADIIPLLVESKDNDVWITFVDDTDMAAVQTVIDAHDPTPAPQPPTAEERLAALENAMLAIL